MQRYGGRDKKYRHELGEYVMNFDSPLPLLKTFTLGTACELKVLNYEKWLCERKKKKNCVAQQRECVIRKEGIYNVFCQTTTGKNNGFPFLDILGYLKISIKIPNLAKWDKSQPGNS